MNFENPILQKQLQKINDGAKAGKDALKKAHIGTQHQIELDDAIRLKKKESLDYFSPEEQKDITEYLSLPEKITSIKKSIANNLKNNINEGTLTVKMTLLDTLENRKRELDEHFKINPHLFDYVEYQERENIKLN